MSAPNSRQVTEFCRQQTIKLADALGLSGGQYDAVAEVLSDVIEMAVATAVDRVDLHREDQTGTRAAIEEDIRREAFREGQLAVLLEVIGELSNKGHAGAMMLVAGIRARLLAEVRS